MTHTPEMVRYEVGVEAGASVLDKTTDDLLLVIPPLRWDRFPQLGALPAFTAYLDCAGPLLLMLARKDWPSFTVTSDELFAVAPQLTSAALVLVPRATSRKALSTVVRQRLSRSDMRERDLIILNNAGPDLISWPRLFIDALDTVDPIAASRLRARSVPHTQSGG